MSKGRQVRAGTTKAELIAQRDAASATNMNLLYLCRHLIEQLRNTRLILADQEANEAELEINRIKIGGKCKWSK
jgi:hypothetical protein